MKNNESLGARVLNEKPFSLTKSAIAVAVVQMLTGNATAFDFVVDHDGDERGLPQDGQCTLREAIARAFVNNAANGDDCDPTGTAGNDTITFSLATPATINLYATNAGANDLVLVIDDDLTIQGPSASEDLVINWDYANPLANPIMRFTNTNVGANPESNISVNNVTLQGADSNTPGGAFVAEGATVISMDSVVLTANRGGIAGGAGTLANGATVTISNSTISSNSVGSRGGAFNLSGGELTLNSSVVSNNSSGSSAGAIYSLGDVIIDDSDIVNSSASFVGGGIRTYNGSLIVRANSHIDGNIADSSGGGISTIYTDVSILNSTVSSNTAGAPGSFTSGGGVQFTKGAGSYSLTLYNAQINNNSADNRGGGLSISGGINSIDGSTISGNILTGPTNITNNNLGGGINNDQFGSSLTITNSTISNNTAAQGGGVRSVGALDITQTNITNNLALGKGGGGIYQANNTTIITESTVSGNSAVEGAGIYAYAGQTNLYNSTVSSNSASGVAAGITVPSDNPTQVRVVNSTIAFNLGGSGIQTERGNLQLENSILSDNDTFDCELIAPATINAVGNNMVGTESGCVAALGAAFTYQGIDPILSPLQDNGGPTFTHGLCKNSPAIDKGDQGVCTGSSIANDQRNETRDGSCDIGAFESLSDLICETPSFYVVPLNGGKSVIFEL